MSRRKKRHEEHENHERWLVSYADFITLLFAFFTAMYAISSVNEGKFKMLSESLNVAFNPSIYVSTSVKEGPRFTPQRTPSMAQNDTYTEMYRKIQSSLKKFEDSSKLSFLMDDEKVTIRITESSLFKPSTDELEEGASEVLAEISLAVREIPNGVRIEGHTDNVPINTQRFPSNWDLSSARAIRVLKYFVEEQKFDPKRLSALGYGEYRPIDTNDTPTGRAKNRRVDVILLRSGVN